MSIRPTMATNFAQAGGGDGGITLLPLLALVVAFFALLAGFVGVSLLVRSKVESRPLFWTAVTVTFFSVVVAFLFDLVVSARGVEAEVVAAEAALFFLLGTFLRRRAWSWSAGTTLLLAGVAYAMTFAFENTYDEVIPLTVGAGLVYLVAGHVVATLRTSDGARAHGEST